MARRILPEIGHKKVVEVSHADIVRLHAKIGRTAPVRANRVVSLLATLFNVASSDALRWRTDNPARGVTKYAETPRQRYLKGDEIARLAAVLANWRNRQVADAVRMLMLTGARRGEVLGAGWDQFDLEAGIWTKPASTTKQRREHVVPLGAPARLLLAATREAQDPPSAWVFPSSGTGTGHLNDIKESWHAIRKAAGLDGVRLHDLRHSFASLAVSGGASLPMIGALLGHSEPSTTARYAHLLDDVQRDIANRVGALIDAAGDAEVVRLREP